MGAESALDSADEGQFDSACAPYKPDAEAMKSDGINLPGEVRIPQRSAVNYRWCLDAEVAR